MARERVQAVQNDVDQEDNASEPDAELACTGRVDAGKCQKCVIPENNHNDCGEVERITVNVLKDEWKLPLSGVLRALERLFDRTRRRILEERPVIRFPVVVASGSKQKRYRQDEDGGRD